MDRDPTSVTLTSLQRERRDAPWRSRYLLVGAGISRALGLGGAQGGRLYTVCPLSRVSPGHLGWGVGWGDAGLRLHMKKPQMA